MTEQNNAAPAAPAEMSDDAIIASILSGGEAEPAAPVAATQNQPAEAAQAAEQGEPSAESGEAIDLTPLKLLGVPKSVLEKLDASELREWSSQTHERESKRSTDLQKLSEERKLALAELASLKKPETTTKAAEPKAPTAAETEFEAQLKSIADELKEFGLPSGEKLAQVVKAMKSATSAQVEGLQAVNQRLASEVGEFFIDQARAKLEAQYPQLSDEATFKAVRAEADALFETGRFNDMPYRQAVSKALDSAAKLVLFDDIVKARTEQIQSQHRERLSSQPTAPSRQAAPVPMSEADREMAIANLLIAGKTDEATRLARS